MQRLSIWIRGRRWGLVVGIGVSVAVTALYLTGRIAPLDLWLLDCKFRHFNSVPADPSIVMIDINDYALERVHSWPWPRDLHAELIDTLTALGARAVLMDIVFAEPKGGRLDDPRLEPDYDVDPAQIVGSLDLSDIVREDDALAAALNRAGRVYLAMFARLYRPAFSPDRLRERVFEVLDGRPDATFESLDGELRQRLAEFAHRAVASGREAGTVEPAALFDSLRIEHLLGRQFGLDESKIADRLGLSLSFVERRIAQVKRTVARRLVDGFRRERPEADWPDVYHRFIPDKDLHVYSSDRQDLLRAFRAVSAERAVLDRAPAVQASLRGRIPHAADLTLPVEKLAAEARVGLVTFSTDPVDGVMRRLPLLVESRGRLLKHLGFALACDVLEIDEGGIRVDSGGFLTMRTRDGRRAWRVPIDASGRSLINWHTNPDDPQWTGSFTHLPAARVMAIPQLRDAIEQEEALLAYAAEAFVRLRAADATALLDEYQGLVRKRRELGRAASDSDEARRVEAVEDRIARIERESIDYVVSELAPQVREFLEGGGTLSQDNDEDRQALLALELAAGYEADPGGTRNKGAIAEKRERVSELEDALRSQIEGKTCLVGYTAAAVADTVNSPVFDEMPGVLAHANLINTLLAGRFPRVVPPWGAALIILLGGLLITLIAAWRDPWVSLLSVLFLVAGLLALSFGAFRASSLHIETGGAVVGVFVAWAMVTLYRQLTEQRQKRAFSKSLAQYTSPAIAERLASRLAERGDPLDLSPVPRVVTCFFSDLKGFTSISERLGASRTRDLLNPYLEAMSAVLIERRAVINKFMGDGIFAFFNPPILPLDNHAEAACESASRAFAALERLKETLGHGELEQEVRALSMRIGLNTGTVFVGDYGSGNKLDYTCIGDTVNLAARLEPACKVFGVRCLISQATRQEAGDRFLTRHLGALQVVGKKQAVHVYELVGQRDEADGQQEAYAALFGQAVEKFQQRAWDEALRLLGQCRDQRPDDAAIDLLADNIRRHQQSPPPDDWNRAIELTTK